MKKILITYDLYERDGFSGDFNCRVKETEARRVAEELEKIGVQATLVNIDDLSLKDNQLLCRGHTFPLEQFDACWHRASVRKDRRTYPTLNAREKNLSILNFIEGHLKTFSPVAKLMEGDCKIKSQHALEAAGVAVPKTLCLPYNPEGSLQIADVEKFFEENPRDTYVVKEADGSGGREVWIFDNATEAKKFVIEKHKASAGQDGGLVLQEFVRGAHPGAHNTERVTVVVGHTDQAQVMYALTLTAAEGKRVTHSMQGGTPSYVALDGADAIRYRDFINAKQPDKKVNLQDIPLLSGDVKQVAVDAAQTFGPGVYGIDIVGSPPKVLEVNVYANKLFVEKNYGVNLYEATARKIADFVNNRSAELLTSRIGPAQTPRTRQ